MGSWVLLIEHSPPCSFPRNCLKSPIIPPLASWWMKVPSWICSWIWISPWGTLFLNGKIFGISLCCQTKPRNDKLMERTEAEETGRLDRSQLLPLCWQVEGKGQWHSKRDHSILELLFTKKWSFFFINKQTKKCSKYLSAHQCVWRFLTCRYLFAVRKLPSGMNKGKKEKGRSQGFFQSNFWFRSRKHVFTKINWCRICLCGYCDTPVISLLLFIKASEHDHGIKPIKSNSSQFSHLWDESHTE